MLALFSVLFLEIKIEVYGCRGFMVACVNCDLKATVLFKMPCIKYFLLKMVVAVGACLFP